MEEKGSELGGANFGGFLRRKWADLGIDGFGKAGYYRSWRLIELGLYPIRVFWDVFFPCVKKLHEVREKICVAKTEGSI